MIHFAQTKHCTSVVVKVPKLSERVCIQTDTPGCPFRLSDSYFVQYGKERVMDLKQDKHSKELTKFRKIKL